MYRLLFPNCDFVSMNHICPPRTLSIVSFGVIRPGLPWSVWYYPDFIFSWLAYLFSSTVQFLFYPTALGFSIFMKSLSFSIYVQFHRKLQTKAASLFGWDIVFIHIPWLLVQETSIKMVILGGIWNKGSRGSFIWGWDS